jgi:hypothetical protein
MQLVPPVGVEPTLGTLLGGQPLPLGYGGAVMIPPTDTTDYYRIEYGWHIFLDKTIFNLGPDGPQLSRSGGDDARACSNSSLGRSTVPRDTISRGKSSASVQSATTRTFLFSVGTRIR